MSETTHLKMGDAKNMLLAASVRAYTVQAPMLLSIWVCEGNVENETVEASKTERSEKTRIHGHERLGEWHGTQCVISRSGWVRDASPSMRTRGHARQDLDGPN